MKNELQKIISGVGLGELKFGATREQVKALLGEPDAVEQISNSDSDEDRSESWHFDALELSMSFDEEEDWRLVTLAVTSDFYELEGIKLIGLSRADFITTLEKMDVDDLELEDDDDEEEAVHELYSSDDLGLNFWVEDNKVTEVQLSLLFIDEETIDWPE